VFDAVTNAKTFHPVVAITKFDEARRSGFHVDWKSRKSLANIRFKQFQSIDFAAGMRA